MKNINMKKIMNNNKNKNFSKKVIINLPYNSAVMGSDEILINTFIKNFEGLNFLRNNVMIYCVVALLEPDISIDILTFKNTGRFHIIKSENELNKYIKLVLDIAKKYDEMYGKNYIIQNFIFHYYKYNANVIIKSELTVTKPIISSIEYFYNLHNKIYSLSNGCRLMFDLNIEIVRKTNVKKIITLCELIAIDTRKIIYKIYESEREYYILKVNLKNNTFILKNNNDIELYSGYLENNKVVLKNVIYTRIIDISAPVLLNKEFTFKDAYMSNMPNPVESTYVLNFDGKDGTCYTISKQLDSNIFSRRYTKKNGYLNILNYSINNGAIELISGFIRLSNCFFTKLNFSDKSEWMIITMDIETYKSKITGKFIPYLIGYYKHTKKEKKYELFHINEGENFIFNCFEKLVVKSNNHHVVYLHNLGGFDIHFIIDILHLKYKDGIKLVYRSGNILGFDLKSDGVTLYFRDSFRLLPISLKKLGESFECKVKKGTIPYDFINEDTLNFIGKIPNEYGDYPDNYNIKEEAIKYIKSDLNLLYEVMSKFTMMIELEYKVSIKKIFSISGLALKIFRTIFYQTAHPIADLDYSINLKLRNGYYGGIVNIYKPQAASGNMKYYDINSLYPYIMLKELPTGMPINMIFNKTRTSIDGIYGMVRVKVKVPLDLDWPFLVYSHDKYGLIQPVGEWTAWYTSDEINYALENKLAEVVEVYEAYHFSSSYPILKSYVESFYKKKSDADQSPDRRSVFKLLLNSLYGIIGIKQDYIKMVAVKNEEVLDFMIQNNIKEIISETNNFTYLTYYPSLDNINNNKNIDFLNERCISNVAISAFISAKSRIYMDSLIRDLRKLKISVIYTDTDSIITESSIPESMISSKIGSFKDEFPNKVIEKVTIVGPKAYELKFNDGSNIIKFKGITNNTLTSDDISRIFKGETVEIENLRFKSEKFINVTSSLVKVKVQRTNNKSDIVYNYDGTWKSVKPWVITEDSGKY